MSRKSKLDGKTGRPDFDKAKGGAVPKKGRNYSHRQLISKIDRYASVARTGKQKGDMLGFKEEHEEDRQRKDMDRGVRDEHFRQGLSAGIHQMDSLEGLHAQDRETDRRDRNAVAKKAIGYAHRNYAPSQLFNSNAKDKARDITVDKG